MRLCPSYGVKEEAMTVYELTKDQMYELKQSHLCERDENISYDKLLDADIIVSDEEIYSKYGNVEFSENDFLSI